MGWEQIAITSKDAVDVEGDGVRVVWTLSRRPTSDWAREFRSAAVRCLGLGQESRATHITERHAAQIEHQASAACLFRRTHSGTPQRPDFGGIQPADEHQRDAPFALLG